MQERAAYPLTVSWAWKFASSHAKTRAIEALRWMAYDPFKRAFMPPEIMRTLDELEKTLDKKSTPSV